MINKIYFSDLKFKTSSENLSNFFIDNVSGYKNIKNIEKSLFDIFEILSIDSNFKFIYRVTDNNHIIEPYINKQVYKDFIITYASTLGELPENLNSSSDILQKMLINQTCGFYLHILTLISLMLAGVHSDTYNKTNFQILNPGNDNVPLNLQKHISETLQLKNENIVLNEHHIFKPEFTLTGFAFSNIEKKTSKCHDCINSECLYKAALNYINQYDLPNPKVI